MSENADETSSTEPEPALQEALNHPSAYEPFPSFAEFAESEFDPTTLVQFVGLLGAAKRDTSNERLKRSVERATKWAAVDTGAIEGLYQVERGFTFTVAADAAAWDNIHLQVGEEAGRAIRNALEGYEYVLDVATQSRPITETWIKELHQVICRDQDTYHVYTAAGPQEHDLPKGTYKQYPNNPFNIAGRSVHAYAPVGDTPAEMARLIDELRSKRFEAAQPVLQAAYAHYAYVCIHPFADGNGRVARALASVFLYRSPGVPLVIFADQKPAYIDALEAADDGEPGLFVQFVGDRVIDVIRMVTDDMRRVERPTIAQRMAAMRPVLLGRGGLPHEEVDALAGLLFDELNSAVHRITVINPVEQPLRVDVRVDNSAVVARLEQYRHPAQARAVQISVNVVGVGATQAVTQLGVMVSKGEGGGADFVVLSPNGAVRTEALIRDLKPSVNPTLTYRLDALAEDVLFEMVDAAIRASETNLRQQGYR